MAIRTPLPTWATPVANPWAGSSHTYAQTPGADASMALPVAPKKRSVLDCRPWPSVVNTVLTNCTLAGLVLPCGSNHVLYRGQSIVPAVIRCTQVWTING